MLRVMLNTPVRVCGPLLTEFFGTKTLGGGGHFCLWGLRIPLPRPDNFYSRLMSRFFLGPVSFRYILEPFLPGTHSGPYPQPFTITFVVCLAKIKW